MPIRFALPRDWTPAFPDTRDRDAARIIRRDHSDGVYEVALVSTDGRDVVVSAYLRGESAPFRSNVLPMRTLVAAFAAPYAAYALAADIVARHEQGRI